MRGHRQIKRGEVVSDRMQKTVVVQVERLMSHPVYGKTVKRTRRFKVHDEEQQCRVGDRVKIVQTRPLSKEKRWRILQIVEKAQ